MGAVISAYKLVRPGRLAGIARIPGRAYAFVIGTGTAVLASSAAAFIGTAGVHNNAENTHTNKYGKQNLNRRFHLRQLKMNELCKIKYHNPFYANV
jgi:hypothetical protein